VATTGNLRVEVKGLSYDSRRAAEGDLFFCVPGMVTDGHLFAGEALSRGACGLVVERLIPECETAPQVLVSDSRRAMATAAAVYYGNPTSKLTLIGVTGTNGKTTTTHLIRHLLEFSGISCGLVGTVGNVVGGRSEPVIRTTPEAIDLQATFNRMVEAEDRAAVIEVSSHALALQRVEHCAFDIGVLTNVTQDHLDFHDDMDDYLAAKSRLFSSLATGGCAVLNLDDWGGRRIRDALRTRVITYGMDPEADIQVCRVEAGCEGTSFSFRDSSGSRHRVSLPLGGRFNVFNALAAIGVGSALGLETPAMVEALAVAPAVPGRFQLLPEAGDITCIVDYAHTPDGLENVLRAAREITRGNLVAVFGCGGDRDSSKRPLMGAIAHQLADRVVVTNDNPRGEDPVTIAREILEGITEDPVGSQGVAVELDRRRAIERAITGACPGDTVIILGKGHETYQQFADRRIHFDDREEALRSLRIRSQRGAR